MSETNDKVDRYESDKKDMYMNNCHRRMFFALIAVCITFSLIIVAYTIREKNWIDALVSIRAAVTTEVTNGTQQSRNP